TGGKALTKELMEEILARTDGVPLFVEELTKTVLEAGVLREDEESYELDGAYLHTIPRTLHGSLLARLDRLGPGREVAQIGAVIGREFSYELLRAAQPSAQPDERAWRFANNGGRAPQLTAAGLLGLGCCRPR